MRSIRWSFIGLSIAGLLIYQFASPSGKDAVYLLSSTSVLVALWWGVRTYRPVQRSPWLLLMAGFGCFLIGDATSTVLDHILGAAKPFPSVADVAYLLFYPLLYVAIGRFLTATGHPDRAAWIDASIWTIGITVLAWEPLFEPYIVAGGDSTLSSITAMAYPLLDVGLLLMVLRMLVGRTSVYPAYVLFTAGFAALVTVDLIFNVREAQHVYVTGEFTDAGWLLLNLLVGAAVLHPSMVRLTIARARPPGPPSQRRLQGLLVPALLVPALMIYQLIPESTSGEVRDVLFTATATAALLVLVVARGRGLLSVAQQRSELLRERTEALELAHVARERATTELRRRVDHDALTGLASRDRFVDELVAELAAWSSGGPCPSIAFLDLNDFKTINDTLGHDSGDLVLVEIGVRLRSALSAGHVIARFGGDEFAVLIQGDAGTAAERLQIAVQPPLLLDGHELRPKVSIGVTTAAGPNCTSGDMLRQADVAMYNAKRAGGGWARYRPGMSAVLLERLDLRTQLVQALVDGEIGPWFQPMVELHTGRVVGFEALARWMRPGRAVSEPSAWLSLAEETGLITAIDHAVLGAALAQFADWRLDPANADLDLAVNLSGRTLQQAEIDEQVLQAMRTWAIPPDRLIIEVLEDVLIDDERVALRLQRLRRAGVRIAFDDFGTGWSSLSYLSKFPVDMIKVDPTFTAELGRTPGADTIPATIIHLARSLSLVAIAEGVESRDQVERLIALGFRIGQGHLFGHARPGNEWPRSGRDRSGSSSHVNLRADHRLLSRATVASPISHAPDDRMTDPDHGGDHGDEFAALAAELSP